MLVAHPPEELVGILEELLHLAAQLLGREPIADAEVKAHLQLRLILLGKVGILK